MRLKKYWGRGYGKEAIDLASDYAFNNLNLQKLTSECYATNLQSYNVFKKAGFEKEGIRKSQYFYNGEHVDSFILGKIRS